MNSWKLCGAQYKQSMKLFIRFQKIAIEKKNLILYFVQDRAPNNTESVCQLVYLVFPFRNQIYYG